MELTLAANDGYVSRAAAGKNVRLVKTLDLARQRIIELSGCALSINAAVWLLVGFSPNNPKYSNDGPLYPGMQRSLALPQLMKDQRGVAALVVIGASIQMVGAVLSLVAS